MKHKRLKDAAFQLGGNRLLNAVARILENDPELPMTEAWALRYRQVGRKTLPKLRQLGLIKETPPEQRVVEQRVVHKRKSKKKLRTQTPKIDIGDYAGFEENTFTYVATNGKKYEITIYREEYSIAWRCQFRNEEDTMFLHAEPHATADGVKQNSIKAIENGIIT